jgi:hypothetical protein
MKWTKELPPKIGWYWMRSDDDNERPYNLAIGNSRLDGFGKRHEWAGPIDEPDEPDETPA